MAAAGDREVVVPGPPIVVGRSPLALDQPALFEAVERLVQGAVQQLESSIASPIEPVRDLDAVHWPPVEGLEHENVERSAKDRHRFGHARLLQGLHEDTEYRFCTIVTCTSGVVKDSKPVRRVSASAAPWLLAAAPSGSILPGALHMSTVLDGNGGN